jgi:hypothetical protein
MNLIFTLTPQRKAIIIIGLTLLTSIGLFVIMGYSSIKEIKNLSLQIEEQRSQLEELYIRGKNIKQTLQQYHEIKPTINTIDNIYVKRGEELKFITTLENIANVQGINQEPKIVSQPNNSNTLQLELTTTASLNRIIKYLIGLESLDYYINIDTIRLSKSSSWTNNYAPTNPELSTIFLATLYYQP